MSLHKISVGTAQFGLPYGISNRFGAVPATEVVDILGQARRSDIYSIDTARAYGDAEEKISLFDTSEFRIVTKLPPVPAAERNAAAFITNQFSESLTRLRVQSVYGVLLHKPEQVFEPHGRHIYEALLSLKTQGLVQKIGVSVYGPVELDILFRDFEFDLVQAPFNLFDRRMLVSGWIDRLMNERKELHVRSVFLQGLLLMPSGQRPSYFNKWNDLLSRYDRWLTETGTEKLRACLRYVLEMPGISRVVVGVSSSRDFQEIVAAAQSDPVQVPDDIRSEDPNLLDPRRWPTLHS